MSLDCTLLRSNLALLQQNVRVPWTALIGGGAGVDDRKEGERRLPPQAVEQVLKRAAALDAAISSTGALTSDQLRDVALEAGISASAVSEALREQSRDEGPAPAWVRFCLWTVPDRATALRYYWIFVGGMSLSPLLMLFGHSAVTRVLLSGGVTAFFIGALWSTSRAVRWMDRNGWHRLP